MSRFGLFGRLGKKDCNKLKEKGDKKFSRGEFYLAIVSYEDALAVSDCPAEVTVPVQENVKICRAKLAAHNLDLAKSHFDAEDLDAAADFATTCLNYAENEHIREEAREILDKIDQKFDQFEEVFGPDKAQHELLPDDDDAYADILIENYPPFIRKEVEENEELRHAMAALNREDLEAGKTVLKMEPSPAVLYFRALYHSLNKDPQTALETFRQLSREHGDLLDDQRWTELIQLIARAKSTESIEEILDEHPSLMVIRAAAVLYMERNDMDTARELMEETLESLPPHRPDPSLIALTGIWNYRMSRFEEAAEHLTKYQNLMAMSGQFTLSPEYAIPMAIALEKTGENDKALEIALHTAKIYGIPEAVELSRNLASHSSREDLKRLAEKL